MAKIISLETCVSPTNDNRKVIEETHTIGDDRIRNALEDFAQGALKGERKKARRTQIIMTVVFVFISAILAVT